MNVFIIARFWDASAGIGALRPMKIAKYLLAQGHSVTVVCGREYAEIEKPCADLFALRENKNYTEIAGFTYSGIFAKEHSIYQSRNTVVITKASEDKSEESNTPTKKQSALSKLKWHIYYRYYNELKIKNAASCAYRAVENAHIDKPDLIISSYAPYEVHLLGAKLKKKYPSSTWVCDYRDPMANSFYQSPSVYKLKFKQQKRISNKADITTIVSKTWRDDFDTYGIKNAHAVYSGFDADDFAGLATQNKKSEKLTFTYTGSLYPGLSDITPLISAIRNLVDTKQIAPDKIKLVYAGAHGGEFLSQSRALDGIAEIECKGFVPRAEALSLLLSGDILLHALFCLPSLRGIITGKLGEYWMSGKPIIAVVTGSERADEFISIMENSGTGFVYDGTDAETSFEEMKTYIKEQYRRKFGGEELMYNRREDFISRFNYENIAKQMTDFTNK